MYHTHPAMNYYKFLGQVALLVLPPDVYPDVTVMLGTIVLHVSSLLLRIPIKQEPCGSTLRQLEPVLHTWEVFMAAWTVESESKSTKRHSKQPFSGAFLSTE